MPVKALNRGINHPGQIAMQRGPQILVYDQVFNKADPKEISLSSKSVHLENANTIFPDKSVGIQAYAVNGEADGKQEKLILVPNADAGQTGGNIATWLMIKK